MARLLSIDTPDTESETTRPLPERAWAFVRVAGPPMFLAMLSAALGLFRIGDKSLWLDEAYSYAAAIEPTREFITRLLSRDMEMALYLAVLKPWLILGHNEASMRTLSVVFGVICVLATYAVGRRFGVGFGAGLLLAVSPFFVQFEQEARHYTLFAAWSAISTLAYLRLLERRDRWRTIIYVFTAAVMIYVHVLGALVIVAHALATLLFQPRNEWRGLLLIYLPVAVAWLPMVRFTITQGGGRIAWIPPLSATTIADSGLALAGGLLAAGAVAVLITAGARRDLPLVWLLAPILGVFLISVVIQPTLQAKYLIGILPAGAVLAARNRTAAVAVLVALSLVGAADWYQNGRKDDWRAAAAWVSESVQPTDGIVFARDYGRIPFAYYARVAEPVYPAYPWSNPFQTYAGDVADFATHPRIWLVRSFDEGAPDAVWQSLESYDTIESRTYGSNGPVVDLMVRLTASD